MIRTLLKVVAGAAALVLATGSATAQTLPSMAFVRGQLIPSATAHASYGAGGHTIDAAELGGRQPEIREAARALRDDPDLMYEFVRNHVRTEWAFGLRKGGLGALIDRSGTPFDQAELLVELVRASAADRGVPIQARYRVGEVELTAAQFQTQFGVSDIVAACRLLADAGIPATFVGVTASADCVLSGALPTVRLLQPWVEIQIGGTWYAFDPSIKTYDAGSPRNVQTGGGLVSGAARTQLEIGADAPSNSPAPRIRNLNAGALDTYLQGRGQTLQADFVQNVPAADADEVIGRPKLTQVYKPASGWRSATPTGYVVYGVPHTVADIPDTYRTRLQISVLLTLAGAPALDREMFVDEIYGRRLELDTDFYKEGVNQPGGYFRRRLRLEADDVKLEELNGECVGPSSTCSPGYSGFIRMTVNHPYLSGAGTYADETVEKFADLALPIALLHGYGEVSPNLAAKWAGERADDKALPVRQQTYSCEVTYQCYPEFDQRVGDLARQKLAAGWLAQFSKMLEMQSRLGGVAAQHHHSIGIVAPRYNLDAITPQPNVPNPGYDYVVSDQYTAIDVDTALSLTSRTNDAAKTAAVSRAVALSAAVLEGSMVEQQQDLPDASSTAARFAWGNRPEVSIDENPCSNAPRVFYDFAGVATLGPLTVFDGSETGCPGTPAVASTEPAARQGSLEGAIQAFQGKSYTSIVSSEESFLGPGWRVGAHGGVQCSSGGTCAPANYLQTKQRGGAIIATRLEGGRVTEVAHAVTDIFGITKGGGGATPKDAAAFDPKRAADLLKDRFVDRSSVLGVDLKTGVPGYTTPTLVSAGTGDVPFALDFQLTYKAGPICGATYNFGACFGPESGGWVGNWDLNFNVSSSGLEAMGQSSSRAAAASLTAFWVMQDIYADTSRSTLQQDVYAALVGDWWRRQMIHNVATFTQGAAGRQHVKLADNSWFSTDNAAARLLRTAGEPAKKRDTCGGSDPSPTRRWDFSGVNFQLRNAQGDYFEIGPWSANYSNQGDNCAWTYGMKVNRWVWPSAQSITFSHDKYGDITGLTTSAGRSATIPEDRFDIAGRTAGRDGQTNRLVNAAGEIISYEEVSPEARTAARRPIPYRRLSRIFDPVKTAAELATPKGAVAYAYDAVGKVSEAYDATALQWVGSRNPHRFYIVDQARGERVDPNGGAYKVNYDPDGDPVRVVDEINRITASVFDGRHRVSSRTYPELDRDHFTYDDRDNPLTLVRFAKPGSPAPTSVTTSATWHADWNKPLSITDPAGRVTDFEYYDASFGAAQGQLRRVYRPAPTLGGTRAVYAYEYDGRGLLNKEYDPTDRITLHTNDTLGNRTSTTTGASAVGTFPALNLTTTFTPDTYGNVERITDPRGHTVGYAFDAMRRRTLQSRAANGQTVLALTQWGYDANGRATYEWRATGIANNWASGWQLWETRFTPTGQVAEEIDPSGDTTRHTYEGMDRRAQTIDGAGRVVEQSYDQAGQLIFVRHGIPGADRIAFESYDYTPNGLRSWIRDAKNNQTSFSYDGFDRLLRTTFADASYEENRYDLAGNIDRLRTREGLFVEWGYDRLDRRTSERAVNGAGTPTPTIEWYRLAASSYAYDLAGRMTQHANPTTSRVMTFDAAGRVSRQTQPDGNYFIHQWDGANNLSALYYPNSSQAASYAYDGMNRMIGVSLGSATALIGYDALSRRGEVTFGDGSKQTYTYEADDDLYQIAHDFAGTADDVNYTYNYDGAGRVVAAGISNSAYQLLPAAGTQAYGSAGALNTYPSIEGRTIDNREDGVMRGDGLRIFSFNELRALRRVTSTANGATVTYDVDAMGQRVYGRYADPAALDPGVSLLASSWRPEVAAERIDLENASGQMIPQNWRYHALGPNPDERLITVDGGTVRYPHTERLGSTIALSQSGAASSKFAYDAYGRPREATAWGFGAGAYAYRYTGQWQDPFTGFQHYKAREYSAAYGRFLQPDPVGFHDDGPNLYAYTANNPLLGGDSTGSCLNCVAAGVGAGLELVVQLTNPQTRSDYAKAGTALANGDVRGALNAAGGHVAAVGLAAGSGFVGQVGAARAASFANTLARQATTIQAGERIAAGVGIAGSAAVGAVVGGGQQAARNAGGDKGSVAMGAIGGAAGSTIGATVGVVGRGGAQLLSDSTGTFIGTTTGKVAAPAASQGTREGALSSVGAAAGRLYEEGLAKKPNER